jgi:hypothetical protein
MAEIARYKVEAYVALRTKGIVGAECPQRHRAFGRFAETLYLDLMFLAKLATEVRARDAPAERYDA